MLRRNELVSEVKKILREDEKVYGSLEALATAIVERILALQAPVRAAASWEGKADRQGGSFDASETHWRDWY